MKAVIQKSGSASVSIEGQIHSRINSGLVILLGITKDDEEKDINYLVGKLTNLRLFEDGEKHFEKSIVEKGAQALVISQFTLYASCTKGRRPDFNNAAKPDIAEPLYKKFVEKLKNEGIEVYTGVFGAMMDVALINQGPVTIILDSQNG